MRDQQAHFDHSYRELGDPYSTPCTGTPVTGPDWLAWNESLAAEIDWPVEWRHTQAALDALAGNNVLDGMDPAATVYAGHQFGSFNPQLGDGRALLLGEWVNTAGKRFDIQLKGAGPTPYSRGGDGRSPVGPVVREYLLSEAMFHLGVPTTRALAAVTTGDRVIRNQIEQGAILTRVASSHLRIGTVQYFAMTERGEGLETLVNYVAQRHYPETSRGDSLSETQAAARSLLSGMGKRLASLVARWQSIGFIHGVLNTDNMLLCGETIDYGPCAFMDNFTANKVFSSIDTGGRYAYANQPAIAHWNLSILAQCLLPLLDDSEESALRFAQGVVDAFPQQYTDVYSGLLAAKFGFDSISASDQPLIDGFFTLLEENQHDFTLAFRWLTEAATGNLDHTPLPELFIPSPALEAWHSTWATRADCSERALERMAQSNPVVIPRNHLVARAITQAEQGDKTLMTSLGGRWQAPFHWEKNDTEWAACPKKDEEIHRTFCGT
ncbi:MAG: YdiU family protein [Cellvibrionales bacterium]